MSDGSLRVRRMTPTLDELEPAEVLEELLEEIADGLGLDVEIEVEEGDGVLQGSLRGEDVGLFIGRRGQTIDAVQHLAQRIVFREGPSPRACGDRRRRLSRAPRGVAAGRCRRGRRGGAALGSSRCELDPMPASERRIVHEHLRDRGDVETHSEGDEPERRLVVSPPGG